MGRGRVGIIAIGRNEGARLVACLNSAVASASRGAVVYVDSGSSDESVEIAKKIGVAVVELDHSRSFTAARARNAGFKQLSQAKPDLEFVQFIDGDCELVGGWLETAKQFLADHPDVAVVCGRRRERQPERPLYNWLCDLEWNTPIGETAACGGDALVRVASFRQVDGFRSELGAGEEPELCLRLREQGWKIWRLDAEMTVHDAAMTRFGQWWRRTARGGYAYAEVSQLHKSSPMRIWQWETMRSIFWAGLLPVMLAVGGLVNKWAFAGLLLYPAQICRVAIRRGAVRADSWKLATFMMLAKFAELQGVGRYFISRLRGKLPAQTNSKDQP
jgi:glycosyltransferase involved in cell wall biosynthesis